MGGGDRDNLGGSALARSRESNTLQFLVTQVHATGHDGAGGIARQHLAHGLLPQGQLCPPVIAGIDDGLAGTGKLAAIGEFTFETE